MVGCPISICRVLGGHGTEDGPLATLFLAAAALALRPLTLLTLIGQISAATVAFTSRPALGVACLLMLTVPVYRSFRIRYGVLSRPTRRLLAISGIALLVVLVLPSLSVNLALVSRWWSGGEGYALPEGSVLAGSLPALYAPLIALLGPFPWAFEVNAESVYMSLYPGMVLWILALPASFLGVWVALRRGDSHVRGVIVATLSLLLTYLAYFGDEGFFRQRFAIELMLLILALFAVERLGYKVIVATSAWMMILGPMMLFRPIRFHQQLASVSF